MEFKNKQGWMWKSKAIVSEMGVLKARIDSNAVVPEIGNVLMNFLECELRKMEKDLKVVIDRSTGEFL